MKLPAIVLLILCFATAAAAQQTVPDYRNAALPVPQRVADLLGRMTLEEKVDQISGGHHYELLDTTGQYTPEQAKEAFQQFRKLDAQVSPHDAAVLRNAAQRFQLEKTRLGIPANFMGEALHGFMEYGSTSFPQVLGLASTWDPELVKNVFTAAGDEMRSAGVSQALSPVLDLARDPRWGRTEETYGEDPILVSRMGVAAIKGLQGVSPLIDHHHVLATAKHFAAHGQPEGGRNAAPANYSERILRESFFLPFQAAVEEAHVGSVMASYNEIDGVPSHINRWLLDRVLRQEWGFQGYVTGDGHGLQLLVEIHHVATDFADAAAKALAAGVDFDLSDGAVYKTLIDQVRAGKVPEQEVDLAVSRILTAKFNLGLFENPYVDPDYARRITNSPEHQKLALQAAREAIVLLKNEGNLLPLNLNEHDPKKIKSIAVIGPNAADVHLGGYSRDPGPGNQISILDGIRKRAGNDVKVLYSEGCKITTGKQGWAAWYENEVVEPDAASNVAGIRAAVATARQADVAIVVIGENESTNREAWSDMHLGDRDSLDLVGAQNDLVKAIVETGRPTVVLLLNGRALSINYVAQHVPAILEGWYLGEQGGTAAAEVLFGDVNPGGKLPLTVPRSIGQLPDYYDHKPSRNRGYLLSDSSPLYPFGYGLSYTTFRFDNIHVTPATIGTGQTATVTVDVTNTGTRPGDEVPQLYIHQKVASVTQPVQKLRAFRRVHLNPGEKSTIEFKLTPDALAILDIHMDRVVEPGIFDLMVGPDSAHTQTIPLEVVKK